MSSVGYIKVYAIALCLGAIGILVSISVPLVVSGVLIGNAIFIYISENNRE
jgi:hypothetical protein